jgi:16S rRNA (guanine527-N7)-methyltransferase
VVSTMLTNLQAPLSVDTIRRALREFELEATADQAACIQRYVALLLRWNEKINLTAIREPLEMLYRHFCESMYAAVAVPLQQGRLADVGSGGGFPGLPLKIIRPDLEVFLIESNVKKATFLAETVRELGLDGVRVIVSRYEELSEEVAPLDVVCSRALGDFGPLLSWAGSAQIAAKQAALWIGGGDLEVVQKEVGWDWRDPIPIPHSLRRILMVGTRRDWSMP